MSASKRRRARENREARAATGIDNMGSWLTKHPDPMQFKDPLYVVTLIEHRQNYGYPGITEREHYTDEELSMRQAAAETESHLRSLVRASLIDMGAEGGYDVDYLVDHGVISG